mmetsp:Transcript_14752/g.34108  ORF Transcript_14752/g.34108 Transcript_14752/m.34108 type:complete len:224 (+) Transcript_14752:696-1367(+)|eukprot:CAMPEP_0116830024 /NCGR_PEP_ID=MMETSP0418-20121206/4536_1 /TAXON_ID=1158023 /ORGANISM="Astrosyne radiata, Strain 13vi08-1A" /LENGTH=223 /DNA_ID=CAMNT_0004459087 /DNA_START=844 /DNA_END=1515 /DNA_ORIENTATION=+
MPSRRQVRFEASSPDAAPIPLWYTDIQANDKLKQTWWSNDEFDTIRESALLLADSTFEERDATNTPKRRSYYYTIVKLQCVSMEEDEELSPSWKESLHFWVGAGSGRGLESYVVEQRAIDRAHRNAYVLDSLISLQDLCEDACLGYDRLSELQRMASESMSACSKKYARIMGDADEMAARMEYNRLSEVIDISSALWGNVSASFQQRDAKRPRAGSPPHEAEF